jgi:hypothetical protein
VKGGNFINILIKKKTHTHNRHSGGGAFFDRRLPQFSPCLGLWLEQQRPGRITAGQKATESDTRLLRLRRKLWRKQRKRQRQVKHKN